jgi:hypothetical protein
VVSVFGSVPVSPAEGVAVQPVPAADGVVDGQRIILGPVAEIPLGGIPVNPLEGVSVTIQSNGDEAVVVQGPVVGVPLGTAPVIPQTATASPSAIPVPQAQDANTIPGATEISMEEMNELLS